MPGPSIIWLRNDLRLADNPAIDAAHKRGVPAFALYVREPARDDMREPGGAAKWWLHHSLHVLAAELSRINIRLILQTGPAAETVNSVLAETGADAVFWNRRYGAGEIATDRVVKSRLNDAGVNVQSFCGHLLFEPWTVLRAEKAPYRVFSPFWKAARAASPPPLPLPEPGAFPVADGLLPAGEDLADWGYLPGKPDWASQFADNWTPGEVGARARLQQFLDEDAAGYASGRDRPDLPSTSRLSPHLRFGEISPRTIWYATQHHLAEGRIAPADAEKFLAELGWREFSYSLLFFNPDIADRSIQGRFDHFPWETSNDKFRAWCEGRTGFPIVDAGMRQLWQTGWMHNRVRMIAASFLIKHLRIDWRQGERRFWDTLVDADPASNPASWQWVAGSGADAAPYFRIFNPMIQGEKFDPAGNYVRHWVPELALLPDKFIHRPWEAPDHILNDARVTLGESYPDPIVDHAAARTAALDAFKSLQKTAA